MEIEPVLLEVFALHRDPLYRVLTCLFPSCSQSSMDSPNLEFEYGDTDHLTAELSGTVPLNHHTLSVHLTVCSSVSKQTAVDFFKVNVYALKNSF